MAAAAFPLRHHLCSCHSTLLLLQFRYPRFHFHPLLSIHISNNHLLHSWPLILCRSRPWDSNAESYNRNDELEAAYDEFYDDTEQWTDVLRDYIDSIWILKVFRSFGWMLPPIILFLLLANGLKAFLMALALPVGQSTLAFTFQRIRNVGKNKSKRDTNTKKRRYRSRASRKVKPEEASVWAGSQGEIKRKKEIRSWFSKNDVLQNNMDNKIANYGGWDEIETGGQPNIGSSRSPAQKLSGSQAIDKEKSKLSWRSSESGTPLLLRLLVSVFPFLISFNDRPASELADHLTLSSLLFKSSKFVHSPEAKLDLTGTIEAKLDL